MLKPSCRWKVVAFDCDGVIVDSFKIMDEILGELSPVKHQSPDSLRDALKAGVDPWNYFDRELGIPPDSFKRRLHARFPEAAFFPGMPKLLRDLWHLNFPPHMVLITSNQATTVKDKLREEQLAMCFQGRIWGCDTPLPSGKRKRLERLRTLFRIEPGECCFITDTQSDVVAGNLAGVDTIGVTWGFHPKDWLVNPPDPLARARETVDSSAELWRCLTRHPNT